MDNREKIKRINHIRKLKKNEKTPQLQRFPKIISIGVIFSVCFVLLLVNVGYIKYTWGDEYERRAITQQYRKQNDISRLTTPNRGSILDRNMNDIAISTTVYKIILDVRVLLTYDQDTIDTTITTLSSFLNIPMTQMREYIALNPDGTPVNDVNYLVIARNITHDTYTMLKEENLTGVFFEEDTQRSYVHGTLASKIIGFVRGDSAWGLENVYNDQMQGEPGRLFRMYDIDNNAVVQQISPKRGNSIVTTLDMTLQQYAEEAVRFAGEEYNPELAAFIIIDPRTSELLALAEYPSFDPNNPYDLNLLTDKSLAGLWSDLPENEKLDNLFKLWTTFSITSTFEPGSIFKPMVVAAALEENLITPDDLFYCGGGLEITPDVRIPCWIEEEGSIHGTQNLTQVLANSCNVGMMKIAELMGREIFYKYQCDFGFGEKTGIDLLGEEDAASSSVRYTLDRLNVSELATSSMGQGFNVTPIQAMNAFAAMVNGGNLMKPYVVSQILDKDFNVIRQNNPTLERRVISEETSDYLRRALQSVISEEGTGNKAYIKGWSIGGKTGTGQQGVRKEDGDLALSFIAYLPVENPSIMAMALIFKPRPFIKGVTSPGPMLKNALLNIIRYKNIQPSGEPGSDGLDNALTLEELSGLDVVEATRKLNQWGINYEVAGVGSVVRSTVPHSGEIVDTDSVVFLYLEEEGTELVTLPDVTGLKIYQAVDILEKNGFTPRVFEQVEKVTKKDEAAQNSEDQTNGEEASGDDTGFTQTEQMSVIAQMPSANSRIPRGTEIKLIVVGD